MDYAVRAARAGRVVWARKRVCVRHPFTEQRNRDEKAWLEPSKSRYQRKFCGQLLSGARKKPQTIAAGRTARTSRRPVRSRCACPLEAAHGPIAAIPVVRYKAPAPLVSCIMPTYGRPEWVQQSIRYFQRADLPDTGTHHRGRQPRVVRKDLPCDPRIRYVHGRQRMTIGAMRNLACEMARGEFIAQLGR